MPSSTVALIGYPVAHSLSPAFQQAAFDACGLDVRYQAWEVPPERLVAAMERLREEGVLGANVTVPHKEHTLRHVDALHTTAEAIRAVNTVVRDNQRLVGYNTDAAAFLRALRHRARFEPEGRVALVLGAGGGARAACYALVSARAAALLIANRTQRRAEALAQAVASWEGTARAVPWRKDALQQAVQEAGLVVNCTTLGMAGTEGARLSPLDGVDLGGARALFFDLVYNPPDTAFLRAARAAGAPALGGLPMLVYQGAASFELWARRRAPVRVMFRAASEALEAK